MVSKAHQMMPSVVAFRSGELISCLSAPETEADTSYQEEEGERLEFVPENLAATKHDILGLRLLHCSLGASATSCSGSYAASAWRPSTSQTLVLHFNVCHIVSVCNVRLLCPPPSPNPQENELLFPYWGFRRGKKIIQIWVRAQ